MLRLCAQFEIPHRLRISRARKPSKVIGREFHIPPAIRTPESSGDAEDKLVVRNFRQQDEPRALKSLEKVARNRATRTALAGSEGHQEAHQPQFVEVRSEKTFVDDRRRRVHGDFVAGSEIVIRQEVVNGCVCHWRNGIGEGADSQREREHDYPIRWRINPPVSATYAQPGRNHCETRAGKMDVPRRKGFSENSRIRNELSTTGHPFALSKVRPRNRLAASQESWR